MKLIGQLCTWSWKMCYPFKGLVTTDKVYRKYSTILPCAATINLFPVSKTKTTHWKTKTTGRNIWMDILLCINVFLKVVCTTLNNVHLCVPTNVVFFLRGNRIMMNHMLMYNKVHWKLCHTVKNDIFFTGSIMSH